MSDNVKASANLAAAAMKDLGLNANKYNIAFTGISGNGKSSLINALRFMGDNDPESAPVDFIECTNQITCYPSIRYPLLHYWDIPGAGTLGHPMKTYFEDKHLYAFDCLVIVIGKRLMEFDVTLANLAVTFEITVVFVRTMARDALATMRKREPTLDEKAAATETRRRIVENTEAQLQGLKFRGRPQIFVVESHDYVLTSSLLASAAASDQQNALLLFDEMALLEYVAKTVQVKRQC